VETGEKASESDAKTALVAKTAATVVLENFILFFSRLILYWWGWLCHGGSSSKCSAQLFPFFSWFLLPLLCCCCFDADSSTHHPLGTSDRVSHDMLSRYDTIRCETAESRMQRHSYLQVQHVSVAYRSKRRFIFYLPPTSTVPSLIATYTLCHSLQYSLEYSRVLRSTPKY
jgi:hypothetical protein